MALRDVTTERLLLARWDARVHTPALEAINARPEAVRYLNDGVPYTPRGDRRQSARFAAHWADARLRPLGRHSRDRPHHRLRRRRPPAVVPRLAHEVEIGWRLHPDAWGHGYATEAGRAALAAGFDDLGSTRIIAVIDPGNAPSVAVATRLGMTHERTLPHPQRPGDIEIYSIVATARQRAHDASGRTPLPRAS